MFHAAPMLLFLALASAVSKDPFNRQRIFGLPAEIVSTNVEESEDSAIGLASTSGERTPSASGELTALGAIEDSAFVRMFLELLHPKTDISNAASLSMVQGKDSSGISSGAGWNAVQGTELLDEQEKDSSGILEEEVFPDIKIVKYELPALPEIEPFDFPQLPDIKLPEVKIFKYELPSIPELPSKELPPFPDFSLPEWKIVKYELPPFPDVEFVELPPFEFSLPDWKIVKYELPTFPEVDIAKLPELQPLQLPDINIMKYELPDWDIKPLDLPPFPEVNMPDIKIIKYELPPTPEMEFALSFPDVTFPKVKYEYRSMPETRQKTNLWLMKSSSEAELQQTNNQSNLRPLTESVRGEPCTKEDKDFKEQFLLVSKDIASEKLVSVGETTFGSIS